MNLKYNEDKTLMEALEYIKKTYSQHYTAGGDGNKKQLFDDIVEEGIEGIGFFRFNAMKYTKRYGKKSGYNKVDILKAIHYLTLLLHTVEVNELNETKTVFPEMQPPNPLPSYQTIPYNPDHTVSIRNLDNGNKLPDAPAFTTGKKVVNSELTDAIASAPQEVISVLKDYWLPDDEPKNNGSSLSGGLAPNEIPESAFIDLSQDPAKPVYVPPEELYADLLKEAEESTVIIGGDSVQNLQVKDIYFEGPSITHESYSSLLRGVK